MAILPLNHEYDLPIGGAILVPRVLNAAVEHFIDQVIKQHGVINGAVAKVRAPKDLHPEIRRYIEEKIIGDELRVQVLKQYKFVIQVHSDAGDGFTYQF